MRWPKSPSNLKASLKLTSLRSAARRRICRRARTARIKGRSTVDKAPVVTLVEREGRVKSAYTEHVTGENLKAAMKECIVPTAQIKTDESPSYSFAGEEFA